MGSTAAPSAWSHDPYRSAATTFTGVSRTEKSIGAAGSGWPTRHYIHKSALAGRQGPRIQRPGPNAQRQRTNWHHGSPSGWECAIRSIQGLAGCNAKLGDGEVGNFVTLSNSCSSHLDGPGEPSGATWRPRGRPWRPPDPSRRTSDGSPGPPKCVFQVIDPNLVRDLLSFAVCGLSLQGPASCVWAMAHSHPENHEVTFSRLSPIRSPAWL